MQMLLSDLPPEQKMPGSQIQKKEMLNISSEEYYHLHLFTLVKMVQILYTIIFLVEAELRQLLSFHYLFSCVCVCVCACVCVHFNPECPGEE